MVRIGLVIVALVLVALVLLGVGAGLGLLDISSHGIAFAHHADTVDSSSTDQPKVISADDLLRKKGLTYAGPAQTPVVDTPKPTPPTEAVAPTPQPAKATSVAVVQKPADKPATPNADPRPQDPKARDEARGEWPRSIIRVIAGSDKAVIDPAGNKWGAADGFDGGSVTEHNVPIDNTRFPDLYHGERWQVAGWHRKVANGGYTVRLHFAETFDNITAADQRVFKVEVQGQSIGSVDIFKEAGGLRRALIRTAHADVTNGMLAIRFIPEKQNPVIYGIEVIPDGLLPAAPARDGRPRAVAFRIDAGSPDAVRDARGNVWEAESGFDDGKTVDRGPIAIANTDFPDIYRTERYEMTAWNQAVANGKYTVNLHFAETSDHINDGHRRIFSLSVQGSELRDLNVAKEAGGNYRALVKTFHVNVTDAKLSILFKHGSTDDGPEINGIEVIPEEAIAIRIDAGSPTAIHDPARNTWEADTGFEGGQVVDRGPIAIANTDFPDLYRTERYGMTAWRKRVPNGKYLVKLHFAETWDGITEAQPRIFHLSVQGNELGDFNVAKEAGGLRRALVKTFHVTVTDGVLSVIFQNTGHNVAEINGIEVIQEQ